MARTGLIASPPVSGPGAIAWLDIGPDDPSLVEGRYRTGPLGLQILPMRRGRTSFSFHGGRLRGVRCIWSASTVSGADLIRPGRMSNAASSGPAVHLLARSDAEPGKVTDASGASSGLLRVLDACAEISEQFGSIGQLYTLNIPLAAIGVEQASLRSMYGQTYDLTSLHSQLLEGAVGLLDVSSEELQTSTALVGIDRYLASLAGLLLRTAVPRGVEDQSGLAQVRERTDAIIYEQATDPLLTPAVIAASLNVSLRQFYRAFNGQESPASRIRRRRLERAAEILATRGLPEQVERIAIECGFSSAEYFSRAFRSEFGVSPRAYRSAHR